MADPTHEWVTRDELDAALEASVGPVSNSLRSLEIKFDRFVERFSERQATPWGAIASAIIGVAGLALVFVTMAAGFVGFVFTTQADQRNAALEAEREARRAGDLKGAEFFASAIELRGEVLAAERAAIAQHIDDEIRRIDQLREKLRERVARLEDSVERIRASRFDTEDGNDLRDRLERLEAR